MKILSIDSSAVVASVAICEDGRLLAEYTVNNGNTHSETLLPMVESLLKTYKISVNDIDAFAATAGPGSFTGIRIGAATLKGLAFGTDKPCIEVSTLEAIAQNIAFKGGLICPVMNARRGQVYTALFRSDGVELERIMQDSAMSVEELDEILSKYKEAVSFAGDGYSVTVDNLKLTSYNDTPDRLRHQSAASVGVVAYKKYTSDQSVSDRAFKVTYLRPSQAERERLEREKNA